MIRATRSPVDAAQLRAELSTARQLAAVRAEDTWARRTQESEHQIAMAQVAERAAAAKRDRQERVRDATDAEALAALYRRATRSGARARIRAQIQGSAEVRALRVAAVRRVALLAGIPVLGAFAAWSTTGVQAGVVRLLDLPDRSAAWWTAWAVEPALITVVALLIIGRAVLRSSGGDTDWRATVAEWTALGLSLALNILGGWYGGWSGLPGALPHAIGPLGCAGTAFLIGLFDSYVTAARPWEDAPRLADLADWADLTPSTTIPPAPVAATPQAVPADQAWFWTPEWQAGEREASEQIAAGDTTSYDSMEALFTDTDDDPAEQAEAVAVKQPRSTKPAAGRKPTRRNGGTAAAVARLRERHPELTHAEIAKRLGVSDRTVRRYLPNPTPSTAASADAEPTSTISTAAGEPVAA